MYVLDLDVAAQKQTTHRLKNFSIYIRYVVSYLHRQRHIYYSLDDDSFYEVLNKRQNIKFETALSQCYLQI